MCAYPTKAEDLACNLVRKCMLPVKWLSIYYIRKYLLISTRPLRSVIGHQKNKTTSARKCQEIKTTTNVRLAPKAMCVARQGNALSFWSPHRSFTGLSSHVRNDNI